MVPPANPELTVERSLAIGLDVIFMAKQPSTRGGEVMGPPLCVFMPTLVTPPP
jgi:hypothetical protein